MELLTITGLSNINESLSTHYLIYKIINNVNGKYYIGQHITNNISDNYAGSGTIIKVAEEKYGLSNFTKEIIFDYDNFDDMNNKERELIQLSNCYPYDPMSYNLKEGGGNGKLSIEVKRKISEEHIRNKRAVGEKNPMYHRNMYASKTEEEIKIIRKKLSIARQGKTPNKGHKHSLETRQLYSRQRKGKQFALGKHWKLTDKTKNAMRKAKTGFIWYTNGIIDKQIKDLNNIPEGFYIGRSYYNKGKPKNI